MAYRRKYLTTSEIEEFINNFSDSEDDLESHSDLEELDPAVCRFIIEPADEPIFEEPPIDEEPFDIQNMPVIMINNVSELSDLNVNIDNEVQNEVVNEKNELKELKKSYNNIIWKTKSLEYTADKFDFSGNDSLSSEIISLETPLQIFNYLFDSSLKEKIVYESNYYANEQNISNNFKINVKDIEKYIGICILTSVHQVTSLHRYWGHEIGNNIIRDAMSINKFEKIRKMLHFNCNDNCLPRTDAKYDRLFKLRPLIEDLINNFKKVPVERDLSIDEQICSFKGKSYLKQYMPMKPHKWGYKLFVLSGVSGFTYNFEIFSGKENETRLTTETNLGSSANVVIRLLRDVPRHANHHVYFDNYYTSLPLVVELSKLGIQSIGTVRRDRLPSCKLPTERTLKDKLRGYSVENVCTVDSTDISLVLWKDTKIVTLLSTFAGELPKAQVRRFIRTKKEIIDVDCPKVIMEYNKHMGGVDLLDSLIGRHKIKLRSKKWYIRLFYHLLDVTVVNAWLLSKRISKDKGIPHLSLVDFRIQLSESLCKTNDSREFLKRGRPSASNIGREIDLKMRRPNAQHMPPKDVREDNISHLSSWMTERQRCKLPGCSRLTFIQCDKCNTYLCFNKDRNCFATFHGRK